jgi:hypothetical protein
MKKIEYNVVKPYFPTDTLINLNLPVDKYVIVGSGSLAI